MCDVLQTIHTKEIHRSSHELCKQKDLFLMILSDTGLFPSQFLPGHLTGRENGTPFQCS